MLADKYKLTYVYIPLSVTMMKDRLLRQNGA